MRVRFSAVQKARLNEIVEERLVADRRARRAETAKLRKCFDELMRINEVLSASLHSLEHENFDLRCELAARSAGRRVQFRRAHRFCRWVLESATRRHRPRGPGRSPPGRLLLH